jgi:hypothetical protein
MFLKFGDKIKSKSLEQTEEVCDECSKKVIIINNKKECGCNENNFYKKSEKIFTQKNFSTNSKE